MKKLIDIVKTKNPKSFIDFLNTYNLLVDKISELKGGSLKEAKKTRIAILSSFTTKGIKETLYVKCIELGLLPEIYTADYNQYAQEIMDTRSNMYTFNPELIILFVDALDIMGASFFDFSAFSITKKKRVVREKANQLINLTSVLTQKTNAKILLHNFMVPTHSPFGILDNKEEIGFLAFFQNINKKIQKTFMKLDQVFVFDYDSFCSRVGKIKIFDYKLYYLADIKISPDCVPLLCDEYLAYIKPLKALSKKCIVLDLDNTLWGGIIGEDGMEGISLGPTPTGRPFLEFQRYLLSLFKRGVILAINSKNNKEDALAVLRKHPYMVLKEEHFAALKINWNDKAFNMKLIAKELNLGLDSMVFFDDDEFNRCLVKSEIPEVLVVDLPKDPSLYLPTLMKIDDFNVMQITKEDKVKGKMYVEQGQRLRLAEKSSDITEYLKKLEMKITLEQPTKFNIPRISQLTQKTNQFNMTTKRYSVEEIKKMSSDKKFLILSLSVSDKYGDNGITGIAIVKQDEEKWFIDTFLLSCRIIGRRIEEVLLGKIIEKAVSSGVTSVFAEFVPTKRNLSNRDFYKKNQFKLLEKQKQKEIWEFKTNQNHKIPDFFHVCER